MSLPPQFLEELRNRVSLAAVVGRRVRLTRKGREFMGLCPFHNEKTPSFSVVEDKGFYHCFGCGAHGDVLSFVMQTEGATFPEAVEKLAAEAGLEVPKVSPQAAAEAAKRKSLYEVTEAACRWFEAELAAAGGEPARRYLQGRGLKADTVKRFRLGFAPNRRGALLRHLKSEGIEEPEAIAAGLVKKDEEGRLREYFFDRVIFPIADKRGRIVAFGGRTLGDGQPKYLNSPDGVLFHKGRTLYNLAGAAEASRRGEPVLVAEGYLDVIALTEAGFHGSVAPLGTAITEEQLGELWKLADEPILCLDGDNAGRRAALRAAERALPLLAPGKSLRFAFLPAGEDPDSLIRKGALRSVQEHIHDAQNLSKVLWNDLLGYSDLGVPEKRAALMISAASKAERISNDFIRKEYLAFFRRRYFEDVVRYVRKNQTLTSSNVVGVFLDIVTHVIENVMFFVCMYPELLVVHFEKISHYKSPDPVSSRIWREMIRVIREDDEGNIEEIIDAHAQDLKKHLKGKNHIRAKFTYGPSRSFAQAAKDIKLHIMASEYLALRASFNEGVASLTESVTEADVKRLEHLKAELRALGGALEADEL